MLTPLDWNYASKLILLDLFWQMFEGTDLETEFQVGRLNGAVPIRLA